MAMTDEFREQVTSIASQVRKAAIGDTDEGAGKCKNVSMAIALRFSELNETIRLCHGTYRTVTGDHPHTWLEWCNYVIDATADQFQPTEAVLIAIREEHPEYHELWSIILNSKHILEIVGRSKDVA